MRPSTSTPRGKNIFLEQHYAALMRGCPAFIIAGCEASESIVDLLSEDSVYEEDQAGPEKPTVVGPEELTVVGPRTGPTLEAPAVAGGGVKGKGKVLQWIASSGRWEVQLVGVEGTKALKSDNLRIA